MILGLSDRTLLTLSKILLFFSFLSVWQAIASFTPLSFSENKVIDPALIPTWHLLGTAPPSPNSLPATRLPLSLRGISLDPNGQDSQVIIAANGQEKVYAVGAQLPGNATLKEILPNQVILLHNGTLETLSLPRQTLHFNPLTPTTLFGSDSF